MRDPVEPAYPENRIPTIKRVTTPQDANLMGTVFGGAILSEIDLAAAIEAHKLHPGHVVTVAMDKVEFTKPIFVGDLISLFTEVVRLGRTSITVRVTVWSQRRQSAQTIVPVTEALVTMVAVDDRLQPVPVGDGIGPRPAPGVGSAGKSPRASGGASVTSIASARRPGNRPGPGSAKAVAKGAKRSARQGRGKPGRAARKGPSRTG